MTDRPILRLPNARQARRLKGHPANRPSPRGTGRQDQGARFRDEFNRLEQALAGDDANVILRQDPSGIAPERALVFVTAVPIARFIQVAEKIGLEVFSENILDDYELNEQLLDNDRGSARPTLYATMPSEDILKRLSRLWRIYQKNESAPHGETPWWNLFDMLAELRPWGPKDRLNSRSREELEFRLPIDENEEVRLELEIWPTQSENKRQRWRADTEARVLALGGRIISKSSITETGFIYEAFLIGITAGKVREMLDNPSAPNGLAMLDGLQFILPQTIAQSFPNQSDIDNQAQLNTLSPFDNLAPFRAVILDGTPIAGHRVLDGGVAIEDVHNLVPSSIVANRHHATFMASLILRGDIETDGTPIEDSRLLSIPVLIDDKQTTLSPNDRLFVDVIHVALTHAFLGNEPLAPDAFIVNFSIGIRNSHFSGLISSLARLLDWWASTYGVLFIVSTGNVGNDLVIPDINSITFEDSNLNQKTALIENAAKLSRHDRTLLAPSEALNVVSVGALNLDLAQPNGILPLNELEIAHQKDKVPAITSAIGLGPFRSIKPDFLHYGGRHNVRVIPNGNGVNLKVVNQSRINGLFVASTGQGDNAIARSRGTSCAAALVTRARINAAAALTRDGGPYAGIELPRRDLALLTRALSVNSSRWPTSAYEFYEKEKAKNPRKHLQAKEETVRYYGHGILHEQLMQESPENGATLIGLGTIRKDQAFIFDLPLPPSIAGQKMDRSMWVTLAWFSPVEPARANYRLAALEAVASNHSNGEDEPTDKGWSIDLKSSQLDDNLIKRGTVWSKRLIKSRANIPAFEDETSLPIRVQCRDVSGGGLDPNEDIRFAITVTLEVEAQLMFDIHQEIHNKLMVRVQQGE